MSRTRLNLNVVVLLILALALGGGGGIAGGAPISEPGLHVLEIYDSTKLIDQKKERLSAHNSNRVPAYVESKKGKFKRFDITTEKSGIDKVWLDAMERKRGDDPLWAIVSNAPYKGGVEQPLPATDDDYLALVKKYGE